MSYFNQKDALVADSPKERDAKVEMFFLKLEAVWKEATGELVERDRSSQDQYELAFTFDGVLAPVSLCRNYILKHIDAAFGKALGVAIWTLDDVSRDDTFWRGKPGRKAWTFRWEQARERMETW